MDQLAAVIEGLPPDLRQIFVMRYVRRIPRRKIAQRLKTSLQDVAQALESSLRECRVRLEALGIDLAPFDNDAHLDTDVLARSSHKSLRGRVVSFARRLHRAGRT